MMMETNGKPKELWQVVREGATPIVNEVRSIITETATRIKSGLPSSWANTPEYLKHFLSIEFYDPEIYITDRPEKIFGEHDTLYTITSTLSLENPDSDMILLPPSEHSHFDKNIKTHRGIGLELFSRLMNEFGFSLGAKDGFVWLGPQVDGEQFVIEDYIASEGQKVDEAIANQLFNKSDVKSRYSQLAINPNLRRLIISINEGNNLYGNDPEITDYVEGLLNTLHKYTGVREGWFNSLEGLLKGILPPENIIDPVNLDNVLSFAAHEMSQPVPKPSRASILEVDTPTLLQLTRNYPFPISSRPPEAIVPSPWVPAEAIKGIYIDSQTDIELLRRFRHLIKPMSDLPHDNWLTDANGTHITPSIALRQGVDPRNPICALRYNRNPVDVWADHLRNGNMAPLSSVPYLELINPKMFTDFALRKIILDMAKSSGLLAQIEAMTNDRDSAEKRILGEALNLRLLSVRHV